MAVREQMGGPHGVQWVSLPGALVEPQVSSRPTRAREKAMAPHSSTLAWKITWTEGPGGLQSMGSLGVGHN